MDYYHIAQICLNGHMINDAADENGERNKNYCPECGEKTITACPFCGAYIHGDYHVDGVVFLGGDTSVDAYCYSCGKPYPWTSSAIKAMIALVSEEESISDIERHNIIETIPDLISETPMTNLASVRMKKCLLKVGKITAEAIRQFAIDFGCEAFKKSIGL